MRKLHHISLKNFLNSYLISQPQLKPILQDNSLFIDIPLSNQDEKLRIQIESISLSYRYQFKFPVFLLKIDQTVEPLDNNQVIETLLEDLALLHNSPNDKIERVKQLINNSDYNLQLSLNNISQAQIKFLYQTNVDFALSESALIAGHQMHPTPKSCAGFNDQEFCQYYPEFKQQFQLHYFMIKNSNLYTKTNLDQESNELIKQYLLNTNNDYSGSLIPIHPWQAKYLYQLPQIQQMVKNNTLIDLGIQGEYFSASSSIRSVYAQNSPIMLKMSLNVMITNSVRMNYERELERAIAVDKFWQSNIAKNIQVHYPQFSAITDPAFLCLRDDEGKLIEESAVLFRHNPFMEVGNNVSCLAALCHDNVLSQGNRFDSLIVSISQEYSLSKQQSAELWLDKFLYTCIEPLLWMFSYYGIALEAHQQNLLVKLDAEGLPIHGYYRDSQGYYISEEAMLRYPEHTEIFNTFASGTTEFVNHHFSYYLIGNSLLGVINALSWSKEINEQALINKIQDKFKSWQQKWHDAPYDYLGFLLTRSTLPYKDNLSTRLCDLDELTAPLAQQSIYSELHNPFYTSRIGN
ncbi:MAG: hypothetical protein E6Q32_09670 [Neisseriales bacterium]|nr:MAG: hypothetical protein E6Q32_09670 [Neisseriales bacterium]